MQNRYLNFADIRIVAKKESIISQAGLIYLLIILIMTTILYSVLPLLHKPAHRIVFGNYYVQPYALPARITLRKVWKWKHYLQKSLSWAPIFCPKFRNFYEFSYNALLRMCNSLRWQRLWKSWILWNSSC